MVALSRRYTGHENSENSNIKEILLFKHILYYLNLLINDTNSVKFRMSTVLKNYVICHMPYSKSFHNTNANKGSL